MSNPITTNAPVFGSIIVTYNGETLKAYPVTVVWSSSDTGIATVDANGKVTPVAPGTATITASCSGTLPDGSTFSNVQVAGNVTVTGVLELAMDFS